MQYYQINMKKFGWGAALIALACLIQPAAYAQSDEEILDTVRVCQRVAELSARLACYDRVLPPAAETAGRGNSVPLPAATPASPRAERETTVIESTPTPVASGSMIRIVEVQKPDLSTSRFIAEDGRVFVQSNARTVIRWPETPFNVEIEMGTFGTTYLRVPGVDSRVRVAVD